MVSIKKIIIMQRKTPSNTDLLEVEFKAAYTVLAPTTGK